MTKKKIIEVRKPQYLVSKEIQEIEQKQKTGGRLPPFFRFLLFSSFVLCGVAAWFVYQRYNIKS